MRVFIGWQCGYKTSRDTAEGPTKSSFSVSRWSA